MNKEERYLNKLFGKNAPITAAEEVIVEPEQIEDNRLATLAMAVTELKLGIAASVDEDGDVYIGKSLPSGYNHYIIIHAGDEGWSYAYANQNDSQGKVLQCPNLLDAVRRFKKATEKE